ACRVGGNQSAARKSQGLRYIRGRREIEAAVARTREEDIKIAGTTVCPNSVEVAGGVDIELDASGISDAMGETGGTQESLTLVQRTVEGNIRAGCEIVLPGEIDVAGGADGQLGRD